MIFYLRNTTYFAKKDGLEKGCLFANFFFRHDLVSKKLSQQQKNSWKLWFLHNIESFRCKRRKKSLYRQACGKSLNFTVYLIFFQQFFLVYLKARKTSVKCLEFDFDNLKRESAVSKREWKSLFIGFSKEYIFGVVKFMCCEEFEGSEHVNLDEKKLIKCSRWNAFFKKAILGSGTNKNI